MMRTLVAAGVCAAAALASSVGLADAQNSSADWPCVHQKVPEITLVAVWTGKPFDPQSLQWRADPQIADLVEIQAWEWGLSTAHRKFVPSTMQGTPWEGITKHGTIL